MRILEAGTAILIVLTSASSCHIDNLRHADAEVAVFDNVDECNRFAEPINNRVQNIRALCVVLYTKDATP